MKKEEKAERSNICARTYLSVLDLFNSNITHKIGSKSSVNFKRVARGGHRGHVPPPAKFEYIYLYIFEYIYHATGPVCAPPSLSSQNPG